jgi:hypothetical protein
MPRVNTIQEWSKTLLYSEPENIVFRCQEWSSEAASPLETAVSLSQDWSSEAASPSETAASLSQRARPRAGSANLDSARTNLAKPIQAQQ